MICFKTLHYTVNYGKLWHWLLYQVNTTNSLRCHFPSKTLRFTADLSGGTCILIKTASF